MRNFPDRPIGCRLFNTKGYARPMSCGTCFSKAIGAPASNPCRWCAVAALRQKTPPYPNRPEGPLFGILAFARPVRDANAPSGAGCDRRLRRWNISAPALPLSRSANGKRESGPFRGPLSTRPRVPRRWAPQWLTAGLKLRECPFPRLVELLERRLPVFGRDARSVVAGDAPPQAPGPVSKNAAGA